MTHEGDGQEQRGPAHPIPRPGSAMWFVVFAGMGLLLVVAVLGWNAEQRFRTEATAKLDGLANAVTQIDRKIDRVTAQGGGRPSMPSGPDPSKVYNVKTANAPSLGPADAPVVIVEFSDFQCPFCARVSPTMEKIEKVYGDKIRRVWKNHPLPMHADAPKAALAAMAANEQGKFWEFHDKLFANQSNLKWDGLQQFARELKLDMKRFQDAVNSAKFKPQIDADTAEAMGMSASGTPSFFVNGHFISGAQPFAAFAKVINAELTRLKVPIPPGAAG